jgi:hypothetical protein
MLTPLRVFAARLLDLVAEACDYLSEILLPDEDVRGEQAKPGEPRGNGYRVDRRARN